jgi:PD-(D/E)XK nuclease superfamily
MVTPHWHGQIINLSADTLKTWDRCPQQFEWKVLNRLNWPSDTRNFVLGTSIHKLMDCQARGMAVDLLLSQADTAIQSTWHTLQQHPATQWPVVASEWGFELPVLLPDSDTPLWVTGRIDRIAWHQNHLWILDWKTGTAAPRQPHKAWQTGVYALAVWQAWASLPAGPWSVSPPSRLTVAYVAVAPPDVKQLTVDFVQPDIDHWQSRLRESIVKMIQATEYGPSDPCPDRWCTFRPMCPITREG